MTGLHWDGDMAFPLSTLGIPVDKTGMSAAQQAAYLKLDQTTPQTFTGGAVIGSGLLKTTSGELGLDTTTYEEAGTCLPLTAITATSHYTGFPDRTSTSLGWSDGSYTLTLTATSDPIWINGVSYTINTLTKALSVAQEAVSGLYWFWLTESAGVVSLNADINPPGFDKCLVATVYWNTTMNKGILSDERHWMGRDKWMHEYLHQTVGARYFSGLTGTFTNTTFSVTAGEFYDEDIEHHLSSDTPMAYPGTAMTTCKVMYHNGTAEWQWVDNSTTPFYAIAGVPQYNSGNTLTAVDNNKYYNIWMFATASVDVPLHCIIGTNQYVTLALARAATVPSFGSMESAEMKLIYKITFQRSGAASVYQEATDFRSTSTIPSAGFTPTDHNTLSNLTFATSGHSGFRNDKGCYQFFGDIRGLYQTMTSIKILDMGRSTAAFPNGITITSWYVDCSTASPTTQFNGNLRYCDAVTTGAFPGANPVLVDVMDSSSGNSSCTDMSTSDLGSGSIPAGKILYWDMDLDPSDVSTTWSIIVNWTVA